MRESPASNTLPTTVYEYDDGGNLDKTDLPNGVVEDYDYDVLNRLEHLTTTTNKDGWKLFSQDYTLLNNGQRGYVIEERFDGSSSTPFSKTKVDWSYNADSRWISETRDGDPTPANRQRQRRLRHP